MVPNVQGEMATGAWQFEKMVYIQKASATTALVNQALRQIAYSNASNTPPATVQLSWQFSDGNTGTQGSGGVGLANGLTTVNITRSNYAPSDLHHCAGSLGV